MTLRMFAACLIVSTASPALAVQTGAGVTLHGVTAIAEERRPTEFVFSCSRSGHSVIGGLSVTIRVPLGSQPGFDFAAFEGPSGSRQALSVLAGHSAVRMSISRFAATGGYQLKNSFSLNVSAARKDTRPLFALRRVLAPLLDRGTVTWQQSSPRPSELRFSAVLRTGQNEGGAAIADAQSVSCETTQTARAETS